MKMKKLLTTLAIVSVGIIAGCQKDSFQEIIGVCPVVVSTNPIDGASGIRLDKIITVTFNEKMNPETITNTSFIIQETTPKAGAISSSDTNATKETDPKAGIISNTNKAASQATGLVEGIISYSGLTATFTPTSTLTPNTNYTGRIKTVVKDLMGNALQVEYVWTFTTSATPTVTLTDPENNTTNVNLNKTVSATFNMSMDSLTLTATTFTLKQGATLVEGMISYYGSTVIFTPAIPLLPNTLYTGTITTGASNKAGIPMVNNYVWTFTTALMPPTVISTDPAINATNVVLNKVVSANFSVPMDPATLTTTSFTLKQGTASIAGTVAYSGSTATFTSSAPLAPNTVYTGTITTGAKNISGTALANDYVWSFTTGTFPAPTVISTDPINNATGVGFNKIVAATFSVPMDASTLTTATVTLKHGTTLVAGVVTYNGATATTFFTPSIALLPNTVYTGTITTGAKNVVGTPLASDYVWTFTTALTPPTVISTNPENNATDVTLNKVVSAIFSAPMNSTTITGTTFTLKQGTNSVAGTIAYSGSTATFTPSVPLTPNTVYTGTITTGAKNVSGTPLASNYVWSFKTGTFAAPTVIYTDPINGATGVGLNKVVAAVFSVPMDASTLTTASFTIKNGTTSVIGIISYSGSTASFTPNIALTDNTVYTCTITTGAKNVLGTPLANDYVWSFTTLQITPPPSILKSAADFGAFGGNAGVTNQGLNTVINNGGISTTAASTLITGFHDGLTNDVYTETPLNRGLVTGGIFAAPPAPGTATSAEIARVALLDANAAYLSISPASKPGGIDPGAGELGGLVLAPGIYKSASGTFNISNGNLTLDAKGDPNAVWIFQTAAGLTVGIAGPTGARSVIMINGGKANNVYWYVGSAATINGAGGGTMVGNIIAYSGVTFSTPGVAKLTTLNGRAISLVASVTMVNTIINVPNP